MFKNTYQSGLLSIFYSCGSNPLAIWDTEVQNGHIKRITDSEVNSVVLEISSTNVATTYITCPKRNQILGIRLPFLVMIIKNLKRYFSFEITILDDKNMRRRFRISNFQSTTKIKPFCTTMPIGLSGGWNQIQFNLADFTRRAYGTHFIETLRVQIHANARLRRIYFCDRLYTDDELPQDYKLYLPLENKQRMAKPKRKEQSVITKTVNSVSSMEKHKPETTPKISKESLKKISADSVAKEILTEMETEKENSIVMSDADIQEKESALSEAIEKSSEVIKKRSKIIEKADNEEIFENTDSNEISEKAIDNTEFIEDNMYNVDIVVDS